MKMQLKSIMLGMAFALCSYAPLSNAVDSCGGYSSIGNPFPCLNGGNCTWWAAKNAKDKWGIAWSELPSTRSAMYWDDDARYKTGYTVSTTPAANTIGVRNSSPYKCGTSTCDYGHVAWIVSVSGSYVTYTEMNYGYWGVNTKTALASSFNAYIYRKSTPTGTNYDGQNPSATGCDRDGQTVAYKYITGGKIELRWSNTCKTNWTRVIPSNSLAYTSATVRRSSDGRTYTYNGRGSIWSPMVFSANIQSCASGTISGVYGSGVCR